MRQLKRFCAGLVMMLALSLPAFAGHMPCGGYTEEPPPPPVASTAESESETVEAAAMTLLESLLSLL